MNRLVTIKSNKYGLLIQLHPKVNFKELLDEVSRIFSDTVNFFHHAKLAVSFEGRILTKDEEHQLIEMISKTAQIEIVCIIDNDKKREQMYKRCVEESFVEKELKEGLFCKGSLHKKQVLESEKSIILLGDVDAGATIATKGNIVVLGKLKGNAYAGITGKQNSFVFSLSMQPNQLKIGNLAVQQSMITKNEYMSMMPQIAIQNGKNITFQSIFDDEAYIQEDLKWAKLL
ncbi:septum site-determining protein MinC [Faecalimonas sp.]